MQNFRHNNVCSKIEFREFELERKLEHGSKLELELEPEPELHFDTPSNAEPS